MKFASVAPVTKAPPHALGSANSSSSQRSAVSSSAAPTGDVLAKPAFWSQALASQFAASGRERAADHEAEEAASRARDGGG